MFAFLFQTFVEGHRFFEQYEIIFTGLKHAAEVYVKSDSSSKTLLFLYMFVMCVFKFAWANGKRCCHRFHVTGSKTCNKGKSKYSLTIFKTLTLCLSPEPSLSVNVGLHFSFLIYF